MSEKKQDYLDEAVKRVDESLGGFVTIVESDEDDQRDRQGFLEVIRKELVQSFKNGIEVGKKRGAKPKWTGKPKSSQATQGA